MPFIFNSVFPTALKDNLIACMHGLKSATGLPWAAATSNFAPQPMHTCGFPWSSFPAPRKGSLQHSEAFFLQGLSSLQSLRTHPSSNIPKNTWSCKILWFWANGHECVCVSSCFPTARLSCTPSSPGFSPFGCLNRSATSRYIARSVPTVWFVLRMVYEACDGAVSLALSLMKLCSPPFSVVNLAGRRWLLLWKFLLRGFERSVMDISTFKNSNPSLALSESPFLQQLYCSRVQQCHCHL